MRETFWYRDGYSHGLVLIFDSTSYKKTHCIKSMVNQTSLIPANGISIFVD